MLHEATDGWIVTDVYVTAADLKDSDKYILLAAGYPMESLVDGNEGPGSLWHFITVLVYHIHSTDHTLII